LSFFEWLLSKVSEHKSTVTRTKTSCHVSPDPLRGKAVKHNSRMWWYLRHVGKQPPYP